MGLSLLCPIIYNLLKDAALGFSIASFILLPYGRGWGFISSFLSAWSLKPEDWRDRDFLQDFSRPGGSGNFRRMHHGRTDFRLLKSQIPSELNLERKKQIAEILFMYICAYEVTPLKYGLRGLYYTYGSGNTKSRKG